MMCDEEITEPKVSKLIISRIMMSEQPVDLLRRG